MQRALIAKGVRLLVKAYSEGLYEESDPLICGPRFSLARRSRTLVKSALVLAFAASNPALLNAQRFTCEEAGRVALSADAARADRFSATFTIPGCANIAPAIVVSALRRAAPNTSADTLASILAGIIFDRRLADSIRVMALDSSQSTERRMLYLELLASYALPGTVIRDGTVRRASLVNVDNFQPPRKLLDEPVRPPFGTRLIRVEDRTRIVATIAAMGVQDPDEQLRRLAATVATELERLIKQSDDNDLFRRTWP